MIDEMRARLYEQGVVLIGGELDDQAAGRIAAELMLLDATSDEPVRVLLNCASATFESAFAIIDVVDLSGLPVHATCIGRAEGAALGILAVCARRLAIPHARLRFAEPPAAFEGRADDVAAWSARREEDMQRFCTRVSEATHRPTEWIANAMGEGRFLDVHEAMRIGLIDEIAQSNAASVRTISNAPIGFRSRRQPR